MAWWLKQSFELKIKGDLIPEDAAEEIIGELQALFARHNAGAALSAKAVFKPTKEFHAARDRINFELGMLNLELQRSPKSPSGFSFQVSRFSFFLRGAGRGEREDESREGRVRQNRNDVWLRPLGLIRSERSGEQSRQCEEKKCFHWTRTSKAPSSH